MSEMPLLAIEIISPSQSIDNLLAKFDAYFELGIKSCWLVMPSVDIVDIYSQPDKHKTFDMNDTEIIDDVMDIRLPIQKIFEWWGTCKNGVHSHTTTKYNGYAK